MPWSAATLWAQTADGPTQAAWNLRVAHLTPSPPAARGSPRSECCSSRGDEDTRSVADCRLLQRSRVIAALEDLRSLRGPPRRVASPSIPRSSPRSRTTEPVGDNALPALSPRYIAAMKQKLLDLHARNEEHWRHVKSVQLAAEYRREGRVAIVREKIRHKEQRFLEPIDRCTGDAEATRELRASSMSIIVAHTTFFCALTAELRRHDSIVTFQRLLAPLVRRWRLQREILAQRYAALWRGRLRRPSVERLIEIIPSLAGWPRPALGRLRRLLRPRLYPKNSIIVHEGEPVLISVIIQHGNATVCQRASKKLATVAASGWRILGERGPGTLQGEEAIQVLPSHETVGSATIALRPVFFATVRVGSVAPVAAWIILRKHFLRVAESIPADILCSATTRSGFEGPPRYVIPAIKIKENLCFRDWNEDTVLDLLEQSKLRHVARGSTLFASGDPARCAYVVWRGTLDIQNFFIEPGFLNLRRPSRSLPEQLADKRFLNPSDAFGDESVLLAVRRGSTVTAVTDALLFEMEGGALLDTFLRNPIAFVTYLNRLCEQRASKMLRPAAADLAGCLNASALAPFLRFATPLVVLSGSSGALPLHTSIIVVVTGTVTIDDVTYSPPFALCSHDVLTSNPTKLRHRCDTLVEAWVVDAVFFAAKVKAKHVAELLSVERSNLSAMRGRLLPQHKSSRR